MGLSSAVLQRVESDTLSTWRYADWKTHTQYVSKARKYNAKA